MRGCGARARQLVSVLPGRGQSQGRGRGSSGIHRVLLVRAEALLLLEDELLLRREAGPVDWALFERVQFEEAASALLDPFALEAADLLQPDRTIVIGMSGRSRVLFVVVLVIESRDVTRIISARKASASQKRKYEEAT